MYFNVLSMSGKLLQSEIKKLIADHKIKHSYKTFYKDLG